MVEEQLQLHHVHDFALRAGVGDVNPFEVELSATFAHESGEEIANLPGFYDGDGTWKVRFRPTREGTWRGRCSSPVTGLDGTDLGPVRCVASANPSVHGQIVIDPAHPRRFAFSDGARCEPLGFECDWLFAMHQARPEEARAFVDLLAGRGFNYIVTNIYAHTGFSDATRDDVYGPPAMYVFGGTNDAPDHSRMNVEFFRDFDRVLAHLHARGVVAHLMIQVQNKKVRWPARRSREDDIYWRYVVARYQAFGNVVWDVGKESYNLLKETGSHDYTLDRIRLIREADAYSHLVTVHDPVAGSAGANSAVDEACDFVSDQVHLGDAARYNDEAAKRISASGSRPSPTSTSSTDTRRAPVPSRPTRAARRASGTRCSSGRGRSTRAVVTRATTTVMPRGTSSRPPPSHRAGSDIATSRTSWPGSISGRWRRRMISLHPASASPSRGASIWSSCPRAATSRSTWVPSPPGRRRAANGWTSARANGRAM
ncbi:MAG: DUF5060 domain-containing protein [Planctomycetota bacterium]